MAAPLGSRPGLASNVLFHQNVYNRANRIEYHGIQRQPGNFAMGEALK